MIKTVFKVVGYEMQSPQGQYMESCVFWVYAKKAKEALKKARAKGVEKKHWSIIEVIEKDESVST